METLTKKQYHQKHAHKSHLKDAQEVVDLTDKVTTLENDNAKLTDKVTKLENDKAKLTDKVTTLENDKAKLTAKVTKFEINEAKWIEDKANF